MIPHQKLKRFYPDKEGSARAIIMVIALIGLMNGRSYPQSPAVGNESRLIYHEIRTGADGKLLPWYSDDPGTAYDHVIDALWNYWQNIPGHWIRGEIHKDAYPEWRKELPFPPKYLLFRTLEDRGIAGDQFAIMLSSFNLYYDYSGKTDVLENMQFQADWYLKYGFSKSSDLWANLPFPCNTTEAPVYDGDLILGKGYTQPDKAGSFGAELIMLYKKTRNEKYLTAAIKIANTLAKYTRAGDYDHSPLPFKVEAVSGEIKAAYCTNWVGTLQLFDGLMRMQKGNTEKYASSYGLINDWMMKFPVQNDRWGPFFEDIPVWSDTEITEASFAWYMLNHARLYPNWRRDVRHMQDWALNKLGIGYWKKYGCTVMGEQTVYKMQGQSHTSRHASVELLYAALTGDSSRKDEAVRQLNFSTYAVDHEGKCRWMNFDTYEIWWTDGYGDFIRHFIRAMAAAPELAPFSGNHILSTTSVLQKVSYFGEAGLKVYYKAFDKEGAEEIRMNRKPSKIVIGKVVIREASGNKAGSYSWHALSTGGVLSVYRAEGDTVEVWE